MILPIVAIVDGVSIQIFFGDHAPPHFHAKFAEHEALITIDCREVLAGSLPRSKLARILKWAKDHQADLEHRWILASARRQFGRIG